MVTHIVMIKFKETKDKEQNIKRAKELIEDLIDKVPTLRSMEVGINFANEDRALDLALIAKFDDREGLMEYANDLEHKKVIEFIKSVSEYSKVVDYETN